MRKGYKLCEMTTLEIQEKLNENSIVILPIAGGVKEHGPHLPYGTDMYVIDYLAEEVVKKAEIFMLPTLNYAYFPAFVDWKGSVSITHQNFINFVGDIIKSYSKFGIRKFLLLDGGISTQDPLKILSRELLNNEGIYVAITNIDGLGKEVGKEICEQKMGGHADESETSCMLAIKNDLVKMSFAPEDYNSLQPGTNKNGIQKIYFPGKMNSKNGINGNASLATVEKGQKIMDAKVNDILEFLNHF